MQPGCKNNSRSLLSVKQLRRESETHMIKNKHNKKQVTTGIIFLILCCVLSHLVIPHHCNDNTFCVTIGGSHSANDETGKDGQAPFSHAEGCILEKVILRDSDTLKQVQEAFPVILPVLHLYCNIHCISIQEKNEDLQYQKYQPDPDPYFISYVVPALGLRAPPLA